ncbi:hypothetical protein G6011_11395 [Alternaria panax]|uniref:Uncharacterized protein n=1 Tax=Alternaria panax TaxID=48097 RepID=A0AAD4IDX9_9PLEO|nr:hypothetical protein G6011_11395 [Alternaria panax]
MPAINEWNKPPSYHTLSSSDFETRFHGREPEQDRIYQQKASVYLTSAIMRVVASSVHAASSSANYTQDLVLSDADNHSPVMKRKVTEKIARRVVEKESDQTEIDVDLCSTKTDAESGNTKTKISLDLLDKQLVP